MASSECMTLPHAGLPAIVCWLLFSGVSSAQSFLFVSPNTRNHMTEESALDSFDSFEQANFLAVANHLAARLCFKPQVWSSEGMDGSNTENSSLVVGCPGDRARYIGALLGRYAHQKWILIFDPAPRTKSSERLFIATFPTDHPADTAKELHHQAINAGAIVIQANLVRFYLWVKDNSQDALMHSFVDAHHGSLEEIMGKATLIGSDSRPAAQRIFDQRIHLYERVHHQALSKFLWSRQLHDLGLAAAQ